MNKKAGLLGLLAVSTFIIALFIFASLNPNFNYVDDFVSKLGAHKQPNAFWFNILGFLLVGLFLVGFGVTYGKLLKDQLVGMLLAIFGIGFAFTSIPFDLEFSDSAVSKAHTFAITLGLASWLLGLARISYNQSLRKSIRFQANITALLLVFSMIGFAIGLWSMPVTHRLVFGVVFSWTMLTAADLLLNSRIKKIKCEDKKSM